MVTFCKIKKIKSIITYYIILYVIILIKVNKLFRILPFALGSEFIIETQVWLLNSYQDALCYFTLQFVVRHPGHSFASQIENWWWRNWGISFICEKYVACEILEELKSCTLRPLRGFLLLPFICLSSLFLASSTRWVINTATKPHGNSFWREPDSPLVN